MIIDLNIYYHSFENNHFLYILFILGNQGFLKKRRNIVYIIILFLFQIELRKHGHMEPFSTLFAVVAAGPTLNELEAKDLVLKGGTLHFECKNIMNFE